MNRIFIGVDTRQPIAYHVLAQSILNHASEPVSITPLWNTHIHHGIREGLTQFTYTRYLVPYLCGYEGRALFMDADMLVRKDIIPLLHAELLTSVAVADVSRPFERPSMMLFNCDECTALTPEYINTKTPQDLSWGTVSFFPKRFNHTIPYDGTPDEEPAVVHFTQGIPCFPETEKAVYADEWRTVLDHCNTTVPWEEIMGHSIHKREMGV